MVKELRLRAVRDMIRRAALSNHEGTARLRRNQTRNISRKGAKHALSKVEGGALSFRSLRQAQGKLREKSVSDPSHSPDCVKTPLMVRRAHHERKRGTLKSST